MNQVLKNFKKRYPFWLKKLEDFIKIPGISFPGFDRKYLVDSANFSKSLMEEAGLKDVSIIELDNSHPFVYAEYFQSKELPTILLYAHYDVQPQMEIKKWTTPPFKPGIRKGRLYGRGSADDKAGIILHLAAIDAFLKTNGELPVNVKILIEGEEEIGSPNIPGFLKKLGKKINCDAVILADSSNFDSGIPTITTSLRGIVSMELEIQVLDHPLHSGMWGGPIPDACMELSKIVSGLVDKKGKIQIPELYRMIKPLTREEIKNLKALPVSEKKFRNQTRMNPDCRLVCKPDEIWKKIWYEPSITVNSFEAGSRKNAGNVILDKAWCRISIRTVPTMEGNTVSKLLREKIKSMVPPYVKLKLTEETSANPWKTDLSNPVFKLAKQCLEKTYKTKAVFAGCGGSVPFTEILSRMLNNVPSLLIGIEDPYTNAHSENESLNLDDFKKTIMAEILFFGGLKNIKS